MLWNSGAGGECMIGEIIEKALALINKNINSHYQQFEI